jgi:rubrerythrin
MKSEINKIIKDLKNSDKTVAQLCEKYGYSYYVFKKIVVRHIGRAEYAEIIHKRFFRVFQVSAEKRYRRLKRTLKKKKVNVPQDIRDEIAIANFRLVEKGLRTIRYMCKKCGWDGQEKPKQCPKCGGVSFEMVGVPVNPSPLEKRHYKHV